MGAVTVTTVMVGNKVVNGIEFAMDWVARHDATLKLIPRSSGFCTNAGRAVGEAVGTALGKTGLAVVSIPALILGSKHAVHALLNHRFNKKKEQQIEAAISGSPSDVAPVNGL
jgi:hypothetical protein